MCVSECVCVYVCVCGEREKGTAIVESEMRVNYSRLYKKFGKGGWVYVCKWGN
jgi:hypothetical protein